MKTPEHSASQVLQLGKEVLKMTVERLDPEIDMSRIKITFDRPTAEELEEAHLSDNSDDAYRHESRCGFAAFPVE